jgi:hypothetical protein
MSNKCRWRELNPRPNAYDASALTPELHRHTKIFGEISFNLKRTSQTYFSFFFMIVAGSGFEPETQGYGP